jgi:hypothetical protein
MTRNVGPEDRVVRIVLALGLAAVIYFAQLSQGADIVIAIVAVYLLLSGLATRCIFYWMAGIDTSIQEQPYSSTDDRSGV